MGRGESRTSMLSTLVTSSLLCESSSIFMSSEQAAFQYSLQCMRHANYALCFHRAEWKQSFVIKWCRKWAAAWLTLLCRSCSLWALRLLILEGLPSTALPAGTDRRDTLRDRNLFNSWAAQRIQSEHRDPTASPHNSKKMLIVMLEAGQNKVNFSPLTFKHCLGVSLLLSCEVWL